LQRQRSLKTLNGSTCSVRLNNGLCEKYLFLSNGTFSTPNASDFVGDAGT
jgi:hypothetical protein